MYARDIIELDISGPKCMMFCSGMEQGWAQIYSAVTGSIVNESLMI